MHLRSKLAYVVLAGLLIAPLSALPGCGYVPQLDGKASKQSIFGSLSVSIGGLAHGQQAQATTADIERFEISLTSDGGIHLTRSINRSQLLDGTSTVSFGQLPEGMVSVSLKVFDRISTEIGSGSAAAQIKAGQSTFLQLTVQLVPTYVVSPDSLAINITFRDGPLIQVPANHPSEPEDLSPIRFVSALHKGLFFLWDQVIQDVYFIRGATAGFGESEVLQGNAFGDGRVLFQVGEAIYYYDIYSEERVTIAFDARDASLGGAKPVATRTGTSITYINQQGVVVRKIRNGDFYTTTKVLGNVFSSVGNAEDIDVSDNEKLLIVSSYGRVHVYDLIGESLTRLELEANAIVQAALSHDIPYIQDVAISSDGRLVAFTAYGSSTPKNEVKLFLLDRTNGTVSEVSSMIVANPASGNHYSSLVFAGGLLYFVKRAGDDASLWTHDLASHVTRFVLPLKDPADTPRLL